MNNAGGALNFNAVLNLKDWDQGIAQMKKDLTGLGSTTKSETAQMDSAFKNLSIGIAGYFSAGALKNFAMELINVRGEFQKTEIAFSTMLGSVGQAKALMAQMVELAAKTPFSLQDVSEGAKQLLAFQVPANQVVDILTRMGNIAAGLGVPLSRINLVYGQVKAKGKLMGDDLRQFTEAGIPMVAELAKKFGKTTGEIQSMVSAGKIGFKDVQDVLFNLTNEGGMFYNLMEKQSASLSGKIANLGDAWDQMLNKIGESNEGLLYSSIQGLTYLVDNYKDVAKTLLELIAAYGIYKAAVIATSVISSAYNKTIASEIALLSFSEKMKLGRAMVTQRQSEATARDTVSELANVRAKYTALQAEVSLLAVKKQAAVQSGITASAKAQEARLQLTLAQAELRSIQATGTAREIELAQKRVTTAQNTVIASQESASIARKRALAAATEFNASKQQLENTAQAVGIAEKTAATAAEAAQVAAKNANSIATTRLTFLQTLQTIATQGAARAQAFLNQTILANPYALATVLLSAMIYAIYKQINALTALEEIQKKYKEQLSQTNITVNEQVAKLNSLISVIKKQTTSYDEASKILKQVNTLTNNRIEGLTVEAIKAGKADAAIKAYTETLYKQAEAMLKVQEISKLEEERKSLLEDLKTVSISEKFNATFNPFNDNYYKDGWQGAKEERLKAIDKTLSDYKKDVEKAVKDGLDLSGTSIETEPPKIKLGIIENLNEQLKTANENIEKAGTRTEIEKWKKIRDKIQEKLDSYDLKKKPKDKQFAEILPLGSVKELQRRASLIQEAIDTAVNGVVKLRTLDKYGNDKDEKGNPFLTGEIITSEEAGKRLDQINEEIKKKQYKNFDEQLAETERQWKAKYQIAKYYGEAIANEQFPELKGSYYDDILQKFKVLENKIEEGTNLTDSEINQWQKLKEILSSLTGQKDPLSNFNDSMEKALQKLPSLYDQIEYLQNLRDSQDNTGVSAGFYIAADTKLQEKIQEQKNVYQEFIKEQETFEQKRVHISQKYDDIRSQIGKNKTLSDPERLRLLDAAGKAEAKEYSDAFLESFQKTDLWKKAFGDVDRLTRNEISKLITPLQLKMNDLIAMGAPSEEIETYRKKIEELGKLSENRGPIGNLIKGFDKLADKIKKGTATNADFNNFIESWREFADYMEYVVSMVGEIMEALGKGDAAAAMKEFVKNLTTTIDGLITAITSYLKGDFAGMFAGILQMVVGIVKMLSTAGDGKKEKGIREWKRAVDELKNSYEELQRVIEKTAGEDQLSMQRQLIANLKEQQRILQEMRSKESAKKKADQDKIASYTQQINDINIQIQDLIDNFQKSITTTDFKELSEKISDALIDAFAKGENAADSFDKVVDQVMKNAVANALRIKILEPAVQQMVDSLYSSMGFGGESGATAQQASLLKSYEDQIKEINEKLKNASSTQAYDLNKIKDSLLEKIKILQQQIAANAVSGSFDGLTQEERDKIKAMGTTAMQQYIAALEQYKELFGESAENAQGLKGDIKGITEKTAGALEGQINAMRIMQAEALKKAKDSLEVMRSQLLVQTQIEINTRPLKGIYDQIKELNSKVKNSLAGVP